MLLLTFGLHLASSLKLDLHTLCLSIYLAFSSILNAQPFTAIFFLLRSRWLSPFWPFSSALQQIAVEQISPFCIDPSPYPGQSTDALSANLVRITKIPTKKKINRQTCSRHCWWTKMPPFFFLSLSSLPASLSRYLLCGWTKIAKMMFWECAQVTHTTWGGETERDGERERKQNKTDKEEGVVVHACV